MPNTDCIWDAPSAYARAWFAVAGESRPHGDRQPITNPELLERIGKKAVGYALKTVLSLLKEDSDRLDKTPDRMLFCWDTRQKKDKQRSPKPSQYHEYQEVMRDVVTKMFGASHGMSTDEADDAVATAAYRSEAEGNEVVIVSGDKDLHQLVGGKIAYFSLKDKVLLRPKQICEKWGVRRPIHTALKLAIIGDSGDRIKGVVGYGPKKAEKLFVAIEEGMDFEKAYHALKDQMPEDAQQQFDESLELVLLKADIEGIPDPALIKLADMDYVTELGYTEILGDYAQVYAQFNGLEFEDVLSE